MRVVILTAGWPERQGVSHARGSDKARRQTHGRACEWRRSPHLTDIADFVLNTRFLATGNTRDFASKASDCCRCCV